YVVEVFQPQPPIAGPQRSETVSLPCGTSAFDRGQYTRRVHRMLIEGPSPSIRIRGLNDFLHVQIYRLWMEYPSSGKDEESVLRRGCKEEEVRQSLFSVSATSCGRSFRIHAASSSLQPERARPATRIEETETRQTPTSRPTAENPSARKRPATKRKSRKR